MGLLTLNDDEAKIIKCQSIDWRFFDCSIVMYCHVRYVCTQSTRRHDLDMYMKDMTKTEEKE